MMDSVSYWLKIDLCNKADPSYRQDIWNIVQKKGLPGIKGYQGALNIEPNDYNGY